jgi:NAD(P)-dependent dehydrogenase (short-subunit alcohol dehydrogenase family)
MASEFCGKVVVVTGATSGIGREFVRVFAAAGAKVVFSGRRADRGKVGVVRAARCTGPP